MTMKEIKVAIIGGGPSGLVTLKTVLELADRNPGQIIVRASLFEAEDRIGGTFLYRSYANARLVSSKQLTAFSDFRLPLEAPDHLSMTAYVQYLEDYTAHFRLQERSHRFLLNTRVTGLKRRDGGNGHIVTWTSPGGQTHTDDFTHVALCAGLHVTPSYPEIAGLPRPTLPTDDRQKGAQVAEQAHLTPEQAHLTPEQAHLTPEQARIQTLHSSAYKSPEIYSDKRVMILGTGETGMDMAYEAVKARAKEIVLCTRHGFLSFPAVLENFTFLGVTYDRPTPIDGLITNLFETAYVHPWVGQSHLRWFVSDAIIKKVLWVLTGTEAGCNQWVGELPPERLGRAYTFLNKSARAMPYINRPWKQRHWLLEKIARYIDPPTVSDDEPHVDLAPFPSHISREGKVIFRANGRKEYERMKTRNFRPDVVVYATGYRQEFPFIDESKGTYPSPSQANCRDIFRHGDPSVAFIGYTRPGVGAIPPQAEMAAQLWSLIIADQLPEPTSKPYYYLLAKEDARIRYGVDYSSYVSQLARDMGSAPTLGQLWWQHGFLVLFTYAFSAAFTTHFRLVGPWVDQGAPKIVKTEILETITRRGIGGNLMMGVIPMVFYAWINLFAYLLEKTLHVAQYFLPGTCDRLAQVAGLSSQSEMQTKTKTMTKKKHV